MSNEVSIPKANPNLDAQGAFQFMNRPMESQYYESEYSIFGNPYNGPIGTAPGNFGAIANPMFHQQQYLQYLQPRIHRMI